MIVLKRDFNKLAEVVAELRKEVEVLNNTLGIYKKREAGQRTWLFMDFMGEEHGSKPVDDLYEVVHLLKEHLGLEYVEKGSTPAKLVKNTKKT